MTPAIAVHGGAGSADQEGRDQRRIVLAAARDTGAAVLSAGGSACGLIAVDRRGSIGFALNTAAMPVEVGRG